MGKTASDVRSVACKYDSVSDFGGIMRLLLLLFVIYLGACAGSSSGILDGKALKGAEVRTEEEMTYGRFVVRMRAALGSGVISNFFMYKETSWHQGVPWEEIDIEVFGKEGSMSWQSNIITGGVMGARTMSVEHHPSELGFSDNYRTFVVEWTPDYVLWMLDGVQIRRQEGGQVEDLKSSMSGRFNIWQPNIVDWVGPFNFDDLPLHMFVNWIEYYRWQDGDFVLAWRDDFDSFEESRWRKATHTFGENNADFVPENVKVQDGYLVLSLTRRGETDPTVTVPQDVEGP